MGLGAGMTDDTKDAPHRLRFTFHEDRDILEVAYPSIMDADAVAEAMGIVVDAPPVFGSKRFGRFSALVEDNKITVWGRGWSGLFSIYFCLFDSFF